MAGAIVSTCYGPVEGIVRDDHLEFRGIPYAARPTGEARFLPPRPPAGWSQPRLAQAWAAAAPQVVSPTMGVDRVSDDCLALNLWTPAADAARRPVLVWLHGGGFLSGCGHQLLYRGAPLAVSQDCVVVTCNYRLGLFGFSNLQAVLGTGFPAATNVGLRDQVAVLAWVRDNIAAFGGDPGCVTVFGESAGGMSVAALLAVPAARGLFHRAIVQSAGGDFVLSPDESARASAAALDALAPDAAARADALLRGDVAAIVRAQAAATRITVDRGLRSMATPQFGMTLLPVVDGDFLPQRPVDAVAGGTAAAVPLLASVTRDEWNLFVHSPQFAGGRNLKAEQLDEARLAHVFERALPGRGTAMLDFYRGLRGSGRRQDNGQLSDLLCWMESDRMFRVPTQRLVHAAAARGTPVFAAQFDWCCPQFGGVLGACHVVDVPFVFGGTGSPVGQFFTGGGAGAEALSGQVMAAWAGFARTGRPAPVDGVDWPAGGGEVLRLGENVRPDRLPSADTLHCWQWLQ